MPSYSSLISNKKFKGNVVIRLGGAGPFYTIHTPDADALGTIVTEKHGYIKDFKQNAQTLDVENARTTFATFTFQLIDKDNYITSLFASNPEIFTGFEVEVWLGRIGESHDFQDYYKLQKTEVSRVTFSGEVFTFTSKEITERLKRAVFNVRSILDADTAAGASTIVAENTISDFPASGTIKLGSEFLAYSSKVDLTKTFTLTGTTAEAHDAGDDILNVVDVTGENPIDFFLKFIISGSGDGAPWDVYSDGLGIPGAEIDISEITTSVRDVSFAGESFDFRLYGIEDGLEFLQEEILKPCSCRIVFSENSLISLTVLDQVVFSAALKKFNSDNIVENSLNYVADDTKIRNVIRFFYDYNHSTENYESIWEQRDALSIARFGERKALEVKSKGIKSASDGLNIAQDRSARWLSRLKNLTPRISLSTQVDVHLANNGERVQVTADLPTEIGDRYFAKELEITKKTFDPLKGTVKFDVGFTTYTGLREAFISPTDHVAVVNSQSSIDIATGRGLKWVTGWKVALYVDTFTRVAGEALNEIASISGDTITFVNPFVTTLTTAHYIKFPNYSELAAGADQKRYSFISNGAANFADGTPPYQITF